MTDQPPFHPAEIVEVLRRHDVEYVAIGAFAALAQGAPIPATADIDVTPRTTAKNLQRLSAALDELEARIRTEAIPEGLPFRHDGKSLGQAQTWNLQCRHGDFDIAFRPSGTDGYDDLIRTATIVVVDGQPTVVASIDDIIRSKTAAGRLKDFAALPGLERYRDSLHRHRPEPDGPSLGL
ncbi:MAG: hypothetical protein JWN67_4133 [Actinomycetia bacterium]|nr:hypothetical protein [Actinomycetes bacterium]